MPTVTNLRKVVRLGTVLLYGKKRASVYAEIKYDGKRLSICGVEGPLPSGNALGGCGQINDSLDPAEIKPAPGWTQAEIARFLGVWKRWHLNDLTTGTPVQEEYLRANPVSAVYPVSRYEVECKALAAVGLNPDPSNGYVYGTSWLVEEVPAEVIEYLAGLPNTDQTPAWV